MPKEEKPKVEIVMENSSITDTATAAVLGGGGAVSAAGATRRHTDSESSENGGAGGDIPSKKPKLDTGVGGKFFLNFIL